MPVAYEILKAPDVVLARYSGAVTMAEIMQMFETYQTDAAFLLERPHIVDLRDVDTSNVGFNEVFSLFAMFGNRYSAAGVGMRVAIVATNEVAFGMSRIFENLTEQSDWASAAIFDSVDEAKAWIARS